MKIEGQLERWWASARGRATAWAYRVFPALAISALAMDAASLDTQGIPHLFARDLREILPNLNDDLLELYGAAAAVLDNRLAFFHRLRKLEPEIDWEPAEDLA